MVPPNQQRFARLTFHPASPGNAECLLYIHNDDADRNEECIRFDISFMKVRPLSLPPLPPLSCRSPSAVQDATNPFDKFAGIYGSKTYWGYDGADTGSDPWVDKLWDPTAGARTQRPRRRAAFGDEWMSDEEDHYYRDGGRGGGGGGGHRHGGDRRYDGDYGGGGGRRYDDRGGYDDRDRGRRHGGDRYGSAPDSPKDFLNQGVKKSETNRFFDEGKRRDDSQRGSSDWLGGGVGASGPRSPEQFLNRGKTKDELLNTVYGGSSREPVASESSNSVEGFLDKGRRRSISRTNF